jgi:hypothetical protein
LGVDPWIILAGTAVVAVGAALIGAQVAVVGSWLSPRPSSTDGENATGRSRTLTASSARSEGPEPPTF